MTTKKQFQWYIPLKKAQLEDVKYTLNEDGTLDIEGIASTINKDLQGDVMLPSAIASMKNQILAMGKNLHGDHKPFLFDGLLGAVNKVYETDDDKLRIGATILSKYAKDVKEMLDIGVNLGFSVGGAMKDYKINKSKGLDISDVYLSEISLTAIPANIETLGTVTTQKGVVASNCFGGICHELSKSLITTREEEINMPENNNEQNNEELDSKIASAVNELWAEKEQGLIEKITESIKPEIKNIVSEAMDDNGESSGENNNDEQPPVEKSFDPKVIGETIAKSVQDEMTNFKKQFFGELNNNRDPNSNVDLTQQEQLLQQQNNENNDVVKTYSPEESATILMKRQRSVNPIMGAVMNNLGE